MAPSPGDEAPLPQDSKNTGGGGGFASVFKGLAGAAKLTKAPPAPLYTTGPSVKPPIAERLDDPNFAYHGLPPNHMDAFEQLRSGSISERVSAAQQLRLAVVDYPLNPVLDIWYAAKDLIEPSKPRAAREAGWELLTACVKHPASTDLERQEYFQTISALANPDDFHLQLAGIVDLTKRGRDLAGFDYEVFPLLTSWLCMKFDSVRVARKHAARTKGKAVASGEDKDFAGLFSFTTDVIKFNFGVIDDEAAETLIDALLIICMNTSGPDDLRACIGVMDAIVTFGAIPGDKLKDCVQILSSIHCLVPSLQKDAWHTLSILCRSHNGQAVVRILLGVLGSLPTDPEKKKEGIREIRGALSVLHKLVSKGTEKGYPSIPYSLLVEGLSTVADATSAWKVHLDILRLINVLFNDTHDRLNPMLVDEDWATLFDIAALCAGGIVSSTIPIDELVKVPSSSRESSETSQSVLAREIMKLIGRVERLLAEQSNPKDPLLQLHDCIDFFVKLQKLLPDSAATLVLDYFKQYRCCFPSDLGWEENLALVLESMFGNRARSTRVRVQAAQIITEVYDMVDMVELVSGQIEEDFVPNLVKRLLQDVSKETDIEVLQEIVSFTACIASTATLLLFDYIVGALRGIMMNDELRASTSPVQVRTTPSTPTSPEPTKTPIIQSPSGVVARGYVQIFMRVMNSDTVKANRLFHVLVTIVGSNSMETDARLNAMKLLFRLRADWANRIFITPFIESDYLAASLYRTEASLARKQAEEASQPSRFSRGEAGGTGRASRGISFGQASTHTQDRNLSIRPGTGSSAKGANQKHQPLWSATDPDALPDTVSQSASPVLYLECEGSPGQSNGDANMEARLPMGSWLETVVNLFQQPSCDWEVFSFVLVYLPSQLSNHSLFKGSVPQLQELRKTLCEQIKTSGAQEPPAASGLRRVDVVVCLFHILTMLLSYHEHFTKTEEDEIVSAFERGMTWERSAKSCVHALSICCYELPMSTSRSLVAILRRMASIVTQGSVAVHILEFLACLSRLPSLYVNFREDEYRIVFGICFRYLQYVREKRLSHRMSIASDPFSPNSAVSSLVDGHTNVSDDLPQYVYALAYHVMTFWFLALKLPDRPNHVGWIAKNIFSEAEAPGSQGPEEQALITIDFMQRVAYADVDESAADPLFTAERFGEIIQKRWLIGNSIVTIDQATASGWAQITKRQPSGTTSYMMRESFRPPPAHQERMATDSTREHCSKYTNTVLPSHLLVQLLSSMPQCTDQARPIPLPDDEAVDRAIRMFDHNPTIDGHKVGVIYVGENQTKESDILANISGSGDYVEFLNGLGTLTKLKGATFNTQGLDRQYDTDGQYTFCWRDRVTEIVFHVTTQMPTNLENDPHCTLKKRHIGNDFVNIIFNDSGLPFKFDTFPSDFLYVNIVITPESRASFVATRHRTPNDVRDSFYKVQVISKPGFPEISPASEMKMISLKALPSFIRLLALNASVFSLVWSSRAGGEHISPWRNRLKDINRLRERYAPSHGPTPSPPGTAAGNSLQVDISRSANTVRDSIGSSLRRSSVATFFSTSSEPVSHTHSHSHRSSTMSTAPTEHTEIMHGASVESLVDKMDFSKWA